MNHYSSRRLSLLGVAASLVSSLCLSSSLRAVDYTWVGSGTDGNWSTAANWAGGVAPGYGNTDVLIFSALTGTQSQAYSDSGSGVIRQIQFASDAASMTISRNASLASPSLWFQGTFTQFLINNSSVTQTIGSNIIINPASSGNSRTVSANSGTLSLQGIALNASSKAIDLVLDGSTTTQGVGIVNGDITMYSSSYAGTLVKNGSQAAWTVLGSVRTNGGVTVNSGTLTMTGSNTYTGGTRLAGGVLRVNGDESLGAAGETVTFSGGTLNILGTTTSSRGMILNSAGIFSISGGAEATLDGVISGTGELRKQFNGRLILGGSNTYSGGTRITGGTVQIAGNDNLGASAGAVTFSGGALDVTQDTTINRSMILESGTGIIQTSNSSTTTWSGTISGSGQLVKQFAGTLIVTAPNSYQGGTTVSGGRLLAENSTGSATGTGAVTVSSGARLGGSGIIAPAAGNDILVEGILSPGSDSGDTLTFDLAGSSNLIFGSSGRIEMTLGTASDLVSFTSVGGWLEGTAILDVTQGIGFGVGDYVLFDNVSETSFSLSQVNGLGGYVYSTAWIGDQFILTVAVPEPSALALGLVAAGALVLVRRRKSH